MLKPAILTVDDDPAVSQAVARDLRERYGADYRVVRATSGDDAVAILSELALQARPVALVASDQRMPGMTGTELLAQVGTLAPGAKTLLLTAYADTEVAIRAINEIDLDYYLLKPWDPPEDKLFPVVDGLLDDWAHANPDHSSEVRVIGHRWSEASHELKNFLARNHVPYHWYDVETDEEGRRLRELAPEAALPLVLVPDGEPLPAPSLTALATALGLRTDATQTLYDLCVVGAGPAGLAAAVYAASEGLRTVVIEREAPGGQAGTSAAIENYLGFPKGLSGSDLTHRAVAQVSRFGAEMVLAREVVGYERRGPVHAVLLDGGASVEARSVVVATGVSYRRLATPGLDRFTGRGVFYGATASEAPQVSGEVVCVVGAANSAGQAVLQLARYAARVVMLVRGDSLDATMSSYLVERIRATETIEVRLRAEVVGCDGTDHLTSVQVRDRDSGVVEECATSHLYVFIGAAPRTDWLGPSVVRDEHGFVVTGGDLSAYDGAWPLVDRAPGALETDLPGVFAAGDVRLGSMKRVASAVGEGAMAVHLVHRYLAST